MRDWIGRLGPLAACAALASSAAAQVPNGAPPATATPSAAPAAPASAAPAGTAPPATSPSGTPPPATPPPPKTTSKSGPGKKVEPALPQVEARVWLIAPSPQEPWTLRIDNEGPVPLRIPADARLLRFEIQRADEKNPKRTKTIKCKAPEGLRPDGFPEARALLLAPGQSYVETFSPYLHCFGKDAAAIAGASVVRSTFGWDPGPKGTRKPPEPPFAAQGTDHPPTHEPARGLGAPTVVLSFQPSPPSIDPEEPAPPPAPAAPAAPPPDDHPPADKPDTSRPAAKEPSEPAPAEPHPAATAPEPAPIVDETAPRLAITAATFADASSPSRVSIGVKVENAGHRPMTVALRARMLSFRVEGPERTVECGASPATHALPREAYQKLKAGGSSSFSVLLAEVCPRDTFARQGLYRVTPTLHAQETGAEAGVTAFTAVVSAPAPTLVRVRSAPEPYHRERPKAVPTSGL